MSHVMSREIPMVVIISGLSAGVRGCGDSPTKMVFVQEVSETHSRRKGLVWPLKKGTSKVAGGN